MSSHCCDPGDDDAASIHTWLAFHMPQQLGGDSTSFPRTTFYHTRRGETMVGGDVKSHDSNFLRARYLSKLRPWTTGAYSAR